MPGLAPDPWLRTVTHPLPVPGVRGVCGPSTIVYNRSTSRRERRATRGASGPVRRWRERRGPALPSRLCRCLPGVTRSGSMRLSLRRGEKTRNLCANTWKQLPLLHSGLPMVRVHRLRVQWAESAGSHATRSSVCAEPLGHERAGELFALRVSEGPRGRRWKGSGLPEEPPNAPGPTSTGGAQPQEEEQWDSHLRGEGNPFGLEWGRHGDS